MISGRKQPSKCRRWSCIGPHRGLSKLGLFRRTGTRRCAQGVGGGGGFNVELLMCVMEGSREGRRLGYGPWNEVGSEVPAQGEWGVRCERRRFRCRTCGVHEDTSIHGGRVTSKCARNRYEAQVHLEVSFLELLGREAWALHLGK